MTAQYQLWTCPDRERHHTRLDSGYAPPWGSMGTVDGVAVNQHHRQKRCPTCGLWVWVPRD